jgi:hypothetical protein
VDIGTLTGTIEIEDQLSDTLTEVSNHVREFASDFEGAMGLAAASVGILVAAVGSAVGSIVALGEKGSTILGVEGAFDRLATAAGTTGDALRDSLSEGVKNSVGEMTLMESTSRLMSSGFKLNTEDAKLMGEAAREMGKATGTDAAQGLQTMSNALLTGRTRGLAMAGIVVNVNDAEAKFAKTLGVTAEQLSDTGKLEAKRIAILDATRAYVDRLGVSELSFKERVQQTAVSIEEWGASLAKSVASSPHVLAAYDSISNAISKAFGGESQSLLETVVGWVNSFSDAVATYGPPIIQTIADIWHEVQHVWREVQYAWDLVPEWFKNVARDAGLAAAAAVLVKGSFDALGGTDTLGALANIAQIWSALPKDIGLARLALGEFFVTASPVLVFASGLGLAVGALNAVYQSVRVVTIAWDLWNQSIQAGRDAATQAAADQTLLANASEYAGHKVTDLGEASRIMRDRVRDLNGMMTDQEKAAKQVGYVVGNVTNGIIEWGAAEENNSFISNKLTEEQKAMAKAIENLNSFGGAWQETLQTMDGLTVAYAIHKLKMGAALSDVVKVMHLTEAQGKALEQQERFLTAATDATTKAFDKQNQSIGLVVPRFSQFHQELTGINDDTGELYGTLIDSGTATFSFANQEEYAAEQTKNLRKHLEDLRNTPGIFQRLTDSVGGLNDIFQSAFEGGGGVAGAVSSYATGVVSSLTSMIPVVGPLISEFSGAIVAGFKSLFGGPSKDELAARDKFGSLQLAGESLAQTIQRVSDQLIKAGKTGPEALAMVQRALDATHTSAGDVEAALNAINGVLDEQKQTQQDLTDAVQRYGFSLAELGPTMQAQKLDEQATQLAKDWDVLVGSGMNVAVVNTHMAESMNDYLQQAVKTGHDVPEAMQPIIQSMIDQGLFLDENGNKITDIKDLGVTFSMTMTEGFKLVADKLETLLEKLGLVPSAMDDMKNAGVDAANSVADAINKIPREYPVHFTIDGATPSGGAAGAAATAMSDGLVALSAAAAQLSGATRLKANDAAWWEWQASMAHASTGGRVTQSGISYYGAGGNVLASPFTPRGTDTVPAMLTPGETVTSVSDTKSSAENIKSLAEAQATTSASLAAIHRLLSDQPRAIGVAVTDAVLLAPRRSA